MSKPYFTQTIYKFPDRLVGGSDSAFVSTAAAELKFNRNPAIHPPYDIVKQCPCEPLDPVGDMQAVYSAYLVSYASGT